MIINLGIKKKKEKTGGSSRLLGLSPLVDSHMTDLGGKRRRRRS